MGVRPEDRKAELKMSKGAEFEESMERGRI